MRLKCFTIPALDPNDATDEVSRFLAEHRVLALDRRFVEDGVLGFRLIRAQSWAGWPTPDPTAVPSRPCGSPYGSGESAGRRCASRGRAPNAHRRPTFRQRGLS